MGTPLSDDASIALSALTSGEAKVLGILLAGLKEDVRRVENFVKAAVDKLEILTRLEEQQRQAESSIARAFAEIAQSRRDIEQIEDRIKPLEEHKAILLEGKDRLRFNWVNVSALLAAFGTFALVVVEYFAGKPH
jgi:hypothetical protein